MRSNKGLLLQAPRVITYTTLGDHAFLAAAPKLRNSLPVNKFAMRKILKLLKNIAENRFFKLAFY